MAILVAAMLSFSSCQQEEILGASAAPITTRSTPPEVPAILQVGAGFEVSFHTYAEGFQVYVCTETSRVFMAGC
jgi:hypothetical protein